MGEIIYLVTYEGQTESPYKWADHDYHCAVELMRQLEREYPDRVWSVGEKDVS